MTFDTVNHKILISKLEHYGIRGLPLHLFQNYLEKRIQFVEINKKKLKCASNKSQSVPRFSTWSTCIPDLYQ